MPIPSLATKYRNGSDLSLDDKNSKIYIVKVNRLYLNSLLVSIVYPCVSKQNNEISMRVKTPTCQTRNGYLNNEKRAESFSLSEVVQRFSGDGKVIR